MCVIQNYKKKQPILELKDLTIEVRGASQTQPLVSKVCFSLFKGETLGIVGESGSGKTLTSLALLGLLPNTLRMEAKTFVFHGASFLKLTEKKWEKIRGKKIAMIFQNPMVALHPCFSIGAQLEEAIFYQGSVRKSAKQIRTEAYELLRSVGISDPKLRYHQYPYQLSGGMCQRVLIAMALAAKPQVLICDEPTTALDVTIQSQILSLLQRLQKQIHVAMIFVSHDIGVIAEISDTICVMYAGEVVEEGSVEKVLSKPLHPYTKGLIQSLPEMHDLKNRKLFSIPATVPNFESISNHCLFASRCFQAKKICFQKKPDFLKRTDQRKTRCFFPCKQ